MLRNLWHGEKLTKREFIKKATRKNSFTRKHMVENNTDSSIRRSPNQLVPNVACRFLLNGICQSFSTRLLAIINRFGYTSSWTENYSSLVNVASSIALKKTPEGTSLYRSKCCGR